MVNSIGSGVHTPKIPSSEAVQKASEKISEKAASSVSSGDEVALSEDALNLVNAQKISEEVSAQLAGNENLILSGDNDRLNALLA